MKDRICLVLVIAQLIALCFFSYCLGIHSEKIGWLEDQALNKGAQHG